MSVKTIIHKWYQKNQHLFFKYANGFYHLNYVANSPLLMLESFKTMLFCKYNATTNTIHTNSPFNKGFLQYAFLEEGLVVLNTELTYKKNVCYHQVITPDTENDYYSLSFNIFSHPTSNNSITVESLGFSNKKWILSKPSFLSVVRYLKNSRSQNVLIYFNQQWLNNYIEQDVAYGASKIKAFFESNKDIAVLPDSSLKLAKIAADIKNNLTQNGINNQLQLKLKTYELVATFIKEYHPNTPIKNTTNIPQKDILKINQIELYLSDNLQNKFIGIEMLSQQFNISPTKLKTDFKAVFGMGVFTYFRQKQLFMAKELLQSGNYRVKEVAHLFGYENTSKFSKAFYQIHGELPSKIVFT